MIKTHALLHTEARIYTMALVPKPRDDLAIMTAYIQVLILSYYMYESVCKWLFPRMH